MQVIGIGCVCGGGGGEKSYIFHRISSVHSFTFPGFLAEDPLQSEKKKKKKTLHNTNHYLLHTQEKKGDGCRGRHPALSLREVQGPRAAVTPARFDVRTSHCLSTSESKWGKVTEPIALNRI